MGMMGVFKWLRKDIIQRDRSRSISSKNSTLNSEAYRTALHAFLERRKNPNDPGYIEVPKSPDRARLDLVMEKNFVTEKNNQNDDDVTDFGVPVAKESEIFEICWVAGTEDRYIEFIYAEWQNTKVALRRAIHPDCFNVVKEDLKVLSQVRHPNILLLMGITQTVDHGLIEIFESIDCTLFNYIHEQGELVSVQSIAKCAGNLAAALKHAHMRGYVHSALSSHCVFVASCGIIKLGGWELASNLKDKPKSQPDYEERLRSEIFRWQAPEIFSGHKPSIATDIYGLTLLIWEMCTRAIPWSGLSMTEIEKQYIQTKQGVAIDVYNFPSILSNLLKKGLQLEIKKRTIDMTKMSRCLLKLEMQYEHREPIYVELISNNNNLLSKSMNIASTLPLVSGSAKSAAHKSNRKSQLSSEEEKTERRRHILKECQNKKAEQTDPVVRNELETREKEAISRFNSLGRSKKPRPTNQDVSTDPRLNIKKLKEALASQREKFFYGLNSSLPDTTETPQPKLFTKINSKSLDSQKPGSYKSYFEMKPSTTGVENLKDSKLNIGIQRSSYASLPKSVRNAVVKSQVLNSNVSNFFETSLWKKERAICILKMQQSCPSDYVVSQRNESPASGGTYTIDCNRSIENIEISDNWTIPKSKSLQTLKEALERATDIIKSAPASQTNLTNPPLNDSSIDNAENVATKESIFEELYQINEVEGEIMSRKSHLKEEQHAVENFDKKIPPTVENRTEPKRATTFFYVNPVLQPGLDVNYSLFDCKDRTNKINCFSCENCTVNRRRSLPAGLGELEIAGCTSLINPQIKKEEALESTFEDLYIDDEFSENSLAPNMILLNESSIVTDDEDLFSDLL